MHVDSAYRTYVGGHHSEAGIRDETSDNWNDVRYPVSSFLCLIRMSLAILFISHHLAVISISKASQLPARP